MRAFVGRIGLALLLCFAIVGAGVVAVNRTIDAAVDTIPRIAVTTAPVGDHGVNYLIIGSDSRAFVEDAAEQAAFGSERDSGPARSDTLMVLHTEGDQAYAVSFPRDLWVQIPGKGMSKINSAYNDGPQKVVDMLKADFDIDINYYLEVNFMAFQRLVDAIGTVGVYFPAPTRDYDTAQQGDTSFFVDAPGCVQLTGDRALQYVRARHMQQLDPTTNKWASVDPIPDIARIERQQSFLRKLGTVAVHRVFDDPLLAFDVRDGVIPTLTADQGFDRAAFDELARAFQAVSENPDALVFETLPWTDGARQAGQQVLYVKKPDADLVLARLRGESPLPAAAAVDGATTSAGNGAATAPTTAPALRPVNVRVKVLNASGVQNGAANAQSSLAPLGFVNGGVGNDTRGEIAKTEIRYKPGDEAKAQLVAAHVAGATLVADATLTGTDVVLVLGRDFKGIAATAAPQTPVATTTPLDPAAACE
jgi:LCP family protein required for cell wall assembly